MLSAVLGLCAAPSPVIELRFDGALVNTGTAGGRATMVEYVSGEGPRYAPGVNGAAVSFAAASRAGGRSREKAGGAVLVPAGSLADATGLTITLWLRTTDPRGPARLVYLKGAWDWFVEDFRLSFKIENRGRLSFYQPPVEAGSMRPGEWAFAAVSYSGRQGRLEMYVGGLDRPPQRVGVWEGVAPCGRGEGAIEIGNLDGIRPLRGEVDNLRIFNTALTQAQIRELWRADANAAGWLFDAYLPPKPRMSELRRSDVCFSTRWARKEAPQIARRFRASRIVWVYTSDRKYIAKLHEAGFTVQATVNSVTRCEDPSGYAVDLDGRHLTAPWMMTFKPRPLWGCNNQPAYRKAVLEQAVRALDAGADWIQFDDWALIVSAHRFGGGCMCGRCMEGFRRYLSGLPKERLGQLAGADLSNFDYRRWLRERYSISSAAEYRKRYRDLPTTPLFEDFQRRSVREFFRWLRAELDKHAGRHVPLSINANLHALSQRDNFLADIVDFLLGETPRIDLTELAMIAKAADALGLMQVVSPFPRRAAETRAAIAATYALGHLFLAPWDIWMGPGKPRYFGEPDDYADLYGFVRDHAELFDGFRAPAAVGVLVDTEHFDYGWTRAVVDRLMRAQAPFCFVPVGHSYYKLPRTAAGLGRLRLLIVPEELKLRAADAAAVRRLAKQMSVAKAAHIPPGLLEAFSPVKLWAPEGIYCLVRAREDGGETKVVLHLLNRRVGADGEPVPLKYVAVGLRRSAVGADVRLRAVVHAPGRSSEEVEVEPLGDVWRVVVPELREWAVVEITVAGRPQGSTGERR